FDAAVWDARTGQALTFHTTRGQKGLHYRAISPDGSLFARTSNKGEISVQEALSGKILHRFGGLKKRGEGLVFSRDNHRLAAADSDGRTILWDLESGKLLHQVQAKPSATFDEFCHAFTPDGKMFIQVRPDDITFRDVQTGKEIR